MSDLTSFSADEILTYLVWGNAILVAIILLPQVRLLVIRKTANDVSIVPSLGSWPGQVLVFALLLQKQDIAWPVVAQNAVAAVINFMTMALIIYYRYLQKANPSRGKNGNYCA